ncbi:TPA: TetR family transcriptional regulator C-terminal domain-containing protein [Pseudomonas putida]
MASIRERNLEAIVEAASREFAQRGFQAARIEEIAAQAGVPKANVHYYFQTKRTLYLAVLEKVMAPLAGAFQALDPQASPESALRRYIRAKLDVCRHQPHAVRVMLGELLHGAHHLPRARSEEVRGLAHKAVACLRGWMDQGLIERTEPEHLLLFIWSTTLAHVRFADIPQAGQLNWPVQDASLQAMVRMLTRMVLGECASAAGPVPGKPAQYAI